MVALPYPLHITALLPSLFVCSLRAQIVFAMVDMHLSGAVDMFMGSQRRSFSERHDKTQVWQVHKSRSAQRPPWPDPTVHKAALPFLPATAARHDPSQPSLSAQHSLVLSLLLSRSVSGQSCPLPVRADSATGGGWRGGLNAPFRKHVELRVSASQCVVGSTEHATEDFVVTNRFTVTGRTA